MSSEVWVVPFLLCFSLVSNPGLSCLFTLVLMSRTFVDAKSREEARRLGEQLRGIQEEAGQLQPRLDAQGVESRELWVAALGACHALFPRKVHDNTVQVNAWLHLTPELFYKDVEDGAVVHFWFHDLVDVREVARGFPMDVNRTDMAFPMPYLEEATDAVLAFAHLEDILRGRSLDREG